MTAAGRKVARLLGDLGHTCPDNVLIIIDYAAACRREEPISTAITESTINPEVWPAYRERFERIMGFAPEA
jgi:hypothetical protein